MPPPDGHAATRRTREEPRTRGRRHLRPAESASGVDFAPLNARGHLATLGGGDVTPEVSVARWREIGQLLANALHLVAITVVGRNPPHFGTEHRATTAALRMTRILRRGYGRGMPRAAILDLDGTLVDTNYHHALAWYRAFRQHEIVLPLWKIHRHIGMGGDKLVAALAGDDVEAEQGDEIRAAEKTLYLALIDETEPLEGARDLLVELKQRAHPIVLATSAKQNELDHYLDLLDARDLANAWTSSADVEATKPDPDLVHAALAKAGTQDAVMVGDTNWDVEAARKAGIDTIAVMTGGFSEQELIDAGAAMVFESIIELRERLDETPLTT